MMFNRRGLLAGLGSLLAAPAIVPITSLLVTRAVLLCDGKPLEDIPGRPYGDEWFCLDFTANRSFVTDGIRLLGGDLPPQGLDSSFSRAKTALPGDSVRVHLEGLDLSRLFGRD